MLLPKFGPLELILILVIVAMLFGVGKLPEVFGSIGKGVKEFRRNANDADLMAAETQAVETPAAPAPVAVVEVPVPAVAPAVNGQVQEVSDVKPV